MGEVLSKKGQEKIFWSDGKVLDLSLFFLPFIFERPRLSGGGAEREGSRGRPGADNSKPTQAP